MGENKPAVKIYEGRIFHTSAVQQNILMMEIVYICAVQYGSYKPRVAVECD